MCMCVCLPGEERYGAFSNTHQLVGRDPRRVVWRLWFSWCLGERRVLTGSGITSEQGIWGCVLQL